MMMMMMIMMMIMIMMIIIKVMMMMMMIKILMMMMMMLPDHICSLGPSSLLDPFHQDTLLDVSIPSDIPPVVLGRGWLYH